MIRGMSKELLDAMNAAAISRMSPYELADRATALRMAEHNTLGVEPIPNGNGGTFYTVTSGLVTQQYNLGVAVEARGDELVRRQQSDGPFTLFADVVELQPQALRNKGRARLFRIEEPLNPELAAASGPFRSVIDEAIVAINPQDDRQRGVRFKDGFAYLRRWEEQPDGDETLYGGYPNGTAKLVATDGTELVTEVVGENDLNQELGVDVNFQGPVQVKLDKAFVTRVTSSQILMGPTEKDTLVGFDISAADPQSVDVITRTPDGRAYSLIPKIARVVLRDGKVEIDGLPPHSKHHVRQPAVTHSWLRGKLTDEQLGMEDVTTEVLSALSGSFATALPLNGADAYERTVDRAREELRLTLLGGNLSPVPGGVGCLAVAARMAELPDHPEGRLVNREYFLQAV
jgi:hypothetical protein